MAHVCQHCGAGAAFCAACGRPLASGVGPATVIGPAFSLPQPPLVTVPRLIIQESGQAARTVPLAAVLTTIGRHPGSIVVIQNAAVSRHHAEIEHRSAETMISSASAISRETRSA